MNYSSQYVAQIVIALAFFLPKFGVNLGSDQLTIVVQGVFIVGGIAWTLYQRNFMKKVATQAESDVQISGVKK